MDIINIAYRFQAQETINHGKGPSLFAMEGAGGSNNNNQEQNPSSGMTSGFGTDLH